MGGRKEREGERTAYYAVMPWQTLCEVDVVSFHFRESLLGYSKMPKLAFSFLYEKSGRTDSLPSGQRRPVYSYTSGNISS